MGAYLPVKEIGIEEFMTGRWWEAAESLLQQSFPPPVDCSGAEVAAEHLLAHMNR
jgi:hypothetical protein